MIGIATAFVILGASIAPFLTPQYVRFEQDWTNVAALTGFSSRALDETVSGILGDLVLWRDDFDVHVSNGPIGEGVLDDAERSHMRDVRNVFTALWLLVFIGVGTVAFAFRRSRKSDARTEVWRWVRNGARGLAVVIAIIGVFAVFAFDAAFEVFHRLFFSAGTYDFDPATSKLVQLFPEAFWSETAIIVGVVIIVVAILTALLGGRRASRIAVAA